MNGFTDRQPAVDVCPGEYRRLLGYPKGATPDERALELERWARAWYAEHGRPWMHAQVLRDVVVSADAVEICGARFTPARLRRTLDQAGATSVVVVAVSAGPEAEAHARSLWEDGKPDEYYFLEVYASAVVEHLVTMVGARLCDNADAAGLVVLPHDSPGYAGWDVSEQPGLLDLLEGAQERGGRPGVTVLSSGMLTPKKSLLAVFGLTPIANHGARLTELVPCGQCPLVSCQFRRLPVAQDEQDEPTALATVAATPQASSTAVLTTTARYTVNQKALSRWAAERLTLVRRDDGSTLAAFRFDGTTCSNMGRPIAFDYAVTLGPRHDGYPIQDQRCGPAPHDTGHRAMCRYMSHRDEVLTAIATEQPLSGRPLDEVLAWSRPHASSGCFCDADSRQHKWGLVLETIHFALARQERAHSSPGLKEPGT